MKKALISIIALAAPLAASAQLLEITAKDTTGLSQAIIANHGDFQRLQFTDGRMTYDRPNIKRLTALYIMGPDVSAPAVVEPGQTLRITMTRKKGAWDVQYKGKNANASLFHKQLERLSSQGWETITLDEYDDEQVTVNKDFDFDAELKRLADEYPKTLKAADKVGDAGLRSLYRHTADVAWLAARINCLSARDRIKGIGSDGELQGLIGSIDPNDTIMQGYGLVERYIQTKVKGTPDDDDLTGYAVSYVGAVDKNVTNPRIRHELLNSIAMTVFNADNKAYVLDDFWNAYKQAADTALVRYYQTIVDSKLATKSGTPCPDETFEDAEGKTHRLSDFFNKGRYLYIDMWATWCIPCVAEIPYMEKHVEHYKDNPKIQFISISLDNNHDAWHRKLAKDKPQWPQFISATKQEMDKLMRDWGVTGIPRFIIVNPDGTINNAAAFRPSDPQFYELMDAILQN